MTRRRTPHLAAATLLGTALCGGALAAPLSNAAFAEQVASQRATFDRSAEAVTRAARLCAHLPAHRAVEEPACVALGLHLRAAAARETPATAAPAKPGLSIAIGPVQLTLSTRV